MGSNPGNNIVCVSNNPLILNDMFSRSWNVEYEETVARLFYYLFDGNTALKLKFLVTNSVITNSCNMVITIKIFY